MQRKRELTFLENLYIPEILRGLALTSRHFFGNLFLHTAHLVGLMKDRRAAATYQYPEEKRPLAPRLRTRHRLTVREEGTPRCVGCMLCETVCPAKCITIVAGEHPDPNVEKYPTRFDIDLGVCVYCGYCVEVCPEDAIRMDTEILDIAAYSRQAMKLDIHELMNPKLRKPDVQCTLKFPHQCRIHARTPSGEGNTGGEGLPAVVRRNDPPAPITGSWEAVYGKKPEQLTEEGRAALRKLSDPH